MTLPFQGERLMAMPPGNTSIFLFWFVLVLSCLKVFPQNFHFVWYWILNLGPVCSLVFLAGGERADPTSSDQQFQTGWEGWHTAFVRSSVTFNDFSLWLMTTRGIHGFSNAGLHYRDSTCLQTVFSLCVSISYKTGKVQPLRSFSQALSGHEDST